MLRTGSAAAYRRACPAAEGRIEGHCEAVPLYFLKSCHKEKILFFVDKLYVSDFFKMTVRDNAIPVVGTDIAKKLDLYPGTKIISEAEAVKNSSKGR